MDQAVQRGVAIGQPMEPLEGAFLSVTASVGLATWDELEKPDQLEARARRALGDARAAGGDQLAFG